MKLLVLTLALMSSSAFAADRACFFADILSGGRSFCVNAGQEIADLNQSGWAKQISSMTVEGATTVVFYSKPNFQGNYNIIPGTNTDLRVIGWNDVAQSLKVKSTGGRVCFFVDVNYGGASYCLVPGQSIATLVTKGWNDKISSVTVEGNASAYFYADINFQGGLPLILKQSTPGLGAWNDKISSVKIGTAAGF